MRYPRTFRYMVICMLLFSLVYWSWSRGGVIVSTRGPRQTIVIPSGCTLYQKWQQIVAVNSLKRMAALTGTEGQFNIVRVIACDKVGQDRDDNLPHPSLSEYYITKDFTVEVGRPEALTLNKPGALHYWMLEGPGSKLDDDHELVVVDADFVFLDNRIPYPLSTPGHPIAAHFALGNFYTKKKVMEFCEGKCDHYNQEWASKNEIGPPYAFRVVDGRGLLRHWYEITKAMILSADEKTGYKWPGEWYADMYAYMFGAEKLGLTHDCVWGMFLVNAEEIWDRLSDTYGVWCFHYAGNYELSKHVKEGEYEVWFHKHQYKEQKTLDMMLSCDEDEQMKMWTQADRGAHKFNPPPWLEHKSAPVGLFQSDKEHAKQQRAKWVIYTLYHRINDAFAMYRELVCDDIIHSREGAREIKIHAGHAAHKGHRD